MSVVLGLTVTALIAVPHVLRLERAAPASAAAIWLSALALRALTVLAGALFVVLVLPSTELFSAITHWCWHAVLPLLATHLGLDGHRIADVASIIPALILSASLVWVSFGIVRAAAAVREAVRRSTIGSGPGGSLIVGGAGVLVAATGIARPQVVLSAGALTAFEDDELAAGLDHEWGHIARRHRFVFLAAELFRAVARFLPGTRRAMAELGFHLERDADEWALARRHDPTALASAICKAAMTLVPSGAVAATLAGGAVTRRIELLLNRRPPGDQRWRGAGTRALAGVMVVATVTLAAALPAGAVAARDALGGTTTERHCPG